MKYLLTIIKIEDNENYATEIAELEKVPRNCFGYSDPKAMNAIYNVSKEKRTNALVLEVNEEQLKAIKAAAFEVFK